MNSLMVFLRFNGRHIIRYGVFLIVSFLNVSNTQAATLIKGSFSSNKSSTGEIRVVYEKEFLITKTLDLKLDKQGQVQFALDIIKLTSVQLKVDSFYFKIYVFPGDKVSITADLGSKRKFVESLKFVGGLSNFNQAFFNVENKSRLKDVHWTTGEKAAPEIIIQKINNYYGLKRKLLREACKNSSDKEKTASRQDSIRDEYFKAGAILNLLPRAGIRNEAAWKFVKNNIPTTVLIPPDDHLIKAAPIRDFWTHHYLPFLIERDVDKEPDLYQEKGYYISALKKVDTTYTGNLKVYAKAALLFNLLQDPSMFRPGADSLYNLTRRFAQISPLSPGAKEALLNEVTLSISRSLILKKGDPVPEFQGRKLDGTPFSFANYKNQILLIDVWASWCSPCIGQIPHLKKYEEYFERKKVVYLMISIDEDVTRWRKAAEKYAPEIKHILARGGLKGEFSEKYNINSIPRYILVRNSRIENPSLPLPSDPNFLSVLNEYLD